MTDHSVIDANCWCYYVDEQGQNTRGLATSTFELALKLGAILFDDRDLIKNQYRESRRGFGEALLDAFFERGVLAGNVRYVAVRSDPQTYRLLKELGVPRREHVYFQTAKAGTAKHLISEDIDFFDPKLKKRGEAEKIVAKRRGTGCVCRAFKRGHNILVCCMEAFVEGTAGASGEGGPEQRSV